MLHVSHFHSVPVTGTIAVVLFFHFAISSIVISSPLHFPNLTPFTICVFSVIINPQLEDLLLRMLIKDPAERITVPQIKVSYSA